DALPGRTVLVVEKGGDHTGAFDPSAPAPDHEPLNAQGNHFRQSLAPAYLARVAEVATDTAGALADGAPTLNVLAGVGLGGGSNVYAGVSLRAPTVAFAQTDPAGRRRWPARYSRAALDPLYARVEAELRVTRLAWTDAGGAIPRWQLATKRDLVFAEGCRRIGATAVPLKLAAYDDANEGWWSQGQRFRGRQNLTMNYLARAKAAGVRFQADSEVDRVAPGGDLGGYVLTGTDRRGGVERPFEIHARVVVVAGGAVGSTALLLRSEDDFTGARALDQGRERVGARVLGRHLSGNGDYGVTGVVGDDLGLDVETYKSKPIGSMCPSFFREHGFLVLPFYAEPLYLALGRISTLQRPERPTALGRWSTGPAVGERDWGLAYKRRLARFGGRMLSMGCLALDASEGEIRLGANDRAEVRWPVTDPATEARWSAAADVMRRIYEALGGEMFLDGYRKDGTVNTSHPLGGCRMAERPEDGVVDPFGESFGNKNLFVVDGAIIPSSLAANPSLTVAAVAESIADALVAGQGTEALASRLA
ncbi:MAG: GMC family oxidoreductase N-terminal domain-containing protein, partial [Myxococcales bacterium]|nr:GMC family oxidoreductase N-terminal domain-containing protein [Myxococcales bacterium]